MLNLMSFQLPVVGIFRTILVEFSKSSLFVKSSPSKAKSFGILSLNHYGGDILFPYLDHKVLPSQYALTPSSFSEMSHPFGSIGTFSIVSDSISGTYPYFILLIPSHIFTFLAYSDFYLLLLF